VTERILMVDGTAWTVSVAGRFTVYARDEVPVRFECVAADGTRRCRLSRFSPPAGRGRARALQELTDAELVAYFHESQPTWTSAELGYART
jgi:hypothetical protein